MNLIEIIHSEGMGIAEPIMPGDSIAVEAGDTIRYNVALSDVTGIARVGDDLYLTVQDSAATRLEGYFFFDFSVKPLLLNFTDVQLSVSDVKALFDLSLDKIDNEGHEQVINLRSGSIVPVGFNEIYYCDAEQYNLKNLQRRGDDLFLMATEQPDQAKIILQGFFIPPELGQEPPQLQLTDPTSGTAKDVLIHPQSAVFGWQGEPLPRAVEGALYAYYFKLGGQDAENFNLTATSNGEELPRWLTFAYLGKGQYLLWGLPPHEAVGALDIAIYAHSLNQKIGLHTQQAFPLAILSANDTTTRPGVDDVAAAEFRKLGGQLGSENYAYLTMTEATLPYMSSAEIAAVSVLAAANFNVYGSLNSGGPIQADFPGINETPISMQYLYKGITLETLLDPKSGSNLLQSTESMNLLRSLFGDAVSEPIAPAEYNTETSLSLTQILSANSESATTEETTTSETLDSILSGVNSSDNFFMSLRIGAPPATLAPEPPTPPPTAMNIIYPSPGDGNEINTLWFQNGPGTVNFIGQNEYFNFASLRLEADGGVPVNLSIDGVGLTNLLNNSGQLFIEGVLIDSTRVFPGDIHLSPVQNTPGYTTYIANDGSILQISNIVAVTSYVDDAMDLNGDHGFVVTSLLPSGSFSYFSTITDLNGDGIGDLVIVDPFFYNEVTVIFGSSTPFAAQIDAASPGVQSVVFSGLTPGDVSDVGDFNGDGFGDLLIAAPYGTNAFIVFGQASFGPSADLPTLAAGGGAMEITTFADFTGGTGLGDINGDGLADFALNNNLDGNVYVVFGTTTPPTSLDVNTLNGTNGFTIVTPLIDVSNNGITFTDINGDGYNDVIFKTQTVPDTETVWVIFGTAGAFPAVINTSTMTSGDGFAIIDSSTIGTYRAFGKHMTTIGDINNDGFDDVAIGEQFTGKVYVIFGSPAFSSGTTFDVATLDGTNGFTLTHSSYLFIQTFAFAGDVNGDGIADMVLSDYSANGFEGAAYVVFGSDDPFTAVVDMIQTDPTKGLTIQHYSQGNGLVSVGAGGDVNGDGLGDIILSNSGIEPPAANVVFGANFSNYITILGNDSEVVINGTGNDVIFAGTADHTINLGPGDNYVNTGTGNDIVNGGSGNDTIVFSEFLVSVDGGSGNDTLSFQKDGITEDFTASAIFSGIDNIDLKALLSYVGNNIELDAATISAMSDSNHLTVDGGGMDVLTLSNNATDMWSSVVGPTYTTYTATAGLNVGTSVDVANTMQPVIIM